MQRNRKTRVRTRLKARSERPRLSVFVSNLHLYAQIIDDTKGITVVAASDAEVKKGKNKEIAEKIGELIAKKAMEKGVKDVMFDRGDKKYHGRIKVLADAARAGGLNF